MDYLIHKLEAMQDLNKSDGSKIKFNYPAALDQLETTRDRMAEYLNRDLRTIQSSPPKTVNQSLTITNDDSTK